MDHFLSALEQIVLGECAHEDAQALEVLPELFSHSSEAELSNEVIYQ